MVELSPAAQALMDAWSKGEGGVYLEGDPERLAAALRAAACQIKSFKLLAIAAELGDQQHKNPMTNQHPLTPPPELVAQWRKEPEYTDGNKLVTMATMTTDRLMQLCKKSAQHGADQELEACCEWLKDFPHFIGIEEQLRAARRPKPPSLKKQALEAFERFTSGDNGIVDDMRDGSLIRAALEALDD